MRALLAGAALLALVAQAPARAADNAPVYGPQLQGFAYPWPVSHYRFASQNDALDMEYMDVAPAAPNGRVAVLLHGKNFCAATWQGTITALTGAGYRLGASVRNDHHGARRLRTGRAEAAGAADDRRQG